jgi:hypothetical protein
VGENLALIVIGIYAYEGEIFSHPASCTMDTGDKVAGA